MPKRTFDRSHGILGDKYADPDGKLYQQVVPGSLAGEPRSDADRADGITDINSDDSAVQFRGVHRLVGDRSPEHLESLLAALEADSSAAPNALLPFIEDHRVRPALVAAARRVPAPDLANFAQAVSLAGGEGAAEVLRVRLEELLNDPRAFQDDPFFNFVGGALVTVAGGLLRLASDEEQSATTLARVVREHPCRFNRSSAANEVCETLGTTHSPEARRVLESVLTEQLATDDPEIFATVARTLVKTNPDQVFERCRKLLADAPAQIRMRVVMALQNMANPRANALLLEHLSREPWPRVAASIAEHLGGEAPAQLRADIARTAFADDSPSLRRVGLVLLRHLAPEMAQSLAEVALVDEPDPLVRRGLEDQLRRAQDPGDAGPTSG